MEKKKQQQSGFRDQTRNFGSAKAVRLHKP